MTYKQAIEKLENIVREMQSPDCDIDRLSEYTTTALQLLAYCKDKLHKTDAEVKKHLDTIALVQSCD